MNALTFTLTFACLAVASSHDADFGLTDCHVRLSCGYGGSDTDGGKRKTYEKSCNCKKELAELEDRLNRLQPDQTGCPQTSYLLPRTNQTSDYLRVKPPINEMTEFSICAWISPNTPSGRVSHAFVSYATPSVSHGNAILIYFDESKLDIRLNNKEQSVDLIIRGKTHLCFTASTTTSDSKVYINGTLLKSLEYPILPPILGGGAFIIGQEQDSVMGGFDPTEAFTGIVENFLMWERELKLQEILSMSNDDCECAKDYALALTTNIVQLEGAVTALPVGH